MDQDSPTESNAKPARRRSVGIQELLFNWNEEVARKKEQEKQMQLASSKSLPGDPPANRSFTFHCNPIIHSNTITGNTVHHHHVLAGEGEKLMPLGSVGERVTKGFIEGELGIANADTGAAESPLPLAGITATEGLHGRENGRAGEVQQTPRPEMEAHLQPQQRPQVPPQEKLQAQPQQQPQVQLEQQPQVQPQSIPRVQPQSIPQVQPQQEPQVQPQQEPQVQPQSIPQLQPQARLRAPLEEDIPVAEVRIPLRTNLKRPRRLTAAYWWALVVLVSLVFCLLARSAHQFMERPPYIPDIHTVTPWPIGQETSRPIDGIVFRAGEMGERTSRLIAKLQDISSADPLLSLSSYNGYFMEITEALKRFSDFSTNGTDGLVAIDQLVADGFIDHINSAIRDLQSLPSHPANIFSFSKQQHDGEEDRIGIKAFTSLDATLDKLAMLVSEAFQLPYEGICTQVQKWGTHLRDATEKLQSENEQYTKNLEDFNARITASRNRKSSSMEAERNEMLQRKRAQQIRWDMIELQTADLVLGKCLCHHELGGLERYLGEIQAARSLVTNRRTAITTTTTGGHNDNDGEKHHGARDHRQDRNVLPVLDFLQRQLHPPHYMVTRESLARTLSELYTSSLAPLRLANITLAYDANGGDGSGGSGGMAPRSRTWEEMRSLAGVARTVGGCAAWVSEGADGGVGDSAQGGEGSGTKGSSSGSHDTSATGIGEGKGTGKSNGKAKVPSGGATRDEL